MTKKNSFKYLVLAGVLFVSSLSLLGCTDASKNNNVSNTQQEEQIENSSDSKPEAENTSSGENSESENKENNNQKVEITYYTYDINSEKLTENKKKVDEISAGNVINALVESKILPEGTSVNTAKVEDANGVRTLFVDVNSKFVNFDLGSSAESLMLQCFGNSMIKTLKVEQVKLTVDGENYSSGHFYFKDDEYLKFK